MRTLVALSPLARLATVQISATSLPRRKRNTALKVQWLVVIPIQLLLLALMLWTRT